MPFDSIPMRLRPLLRLRLLAALAPVTALALAAGCGGGDGTDPPGDGGVDSGSMVEEDAGRIPPGAIPCDTDAECDDGAACTDDDCNDRGFCENLRQNAMCQDDSFCNGRELCDPEVGTADALGCVAGPPETCNDDDVCTLDRCDEENDVCISDPRDFDGDGEVDWFCEAGTDCDDRDPFVNGSINEQCGDGRDNDCDGETDEEDCGRPPHDLCSDALDVSEGGTFVIDARGTAPDYAGGFGAPVGFSCTTSTVADVALRFTIDQAQDVSISAVSDSLTNIAVHRATFDPDAEPERTEEICTTVDDEVDCETFGDPVRIRSLEPGTYFVLVQDFAASPELAVTVAFDEPTEPPSNESCAAPTDVSAGGVFVGDLVDVADDISRLTCLTGDHDLAYTFTIDEPRNVDVRLASPVGEFMGFEVRGACDDAATALRCSSGAPATATLYSLPAGTYFIIVDSREETDFELDVAFDEATPPPPGEDCSNPITLDLDTPTTAAFSARTDDVRASCLSGSIRDAVYEFTLTEERDVTVRADGSSFTVVDLQTTCGDTTTTRGCDFASPTPIVRRRRLGPGTYTVIVESFSTRDVELEVQTSPPATPTEVDGNDVCADAVPVPATGGVYTGSTILLSNRFETRSFCGNFSRSQDATFKLDLTTTRRVIATTEGSGFDTTLHLRSGAASVVCVDADDDDVFDGSELVCNDDEFSGIDTSLIDRTLGAGTHYLVVDGWGTSESGTYEIEILVLDP